MKAKHVIAYYGGQAAAARELGLTRSAVYQWARRDRVPWVWQWVIQTATQGALKADRRVAKRKVSRSN